MQQFLSKNILFLLIFVFINGCSKKEVILPTIRVFEVFSDSANTYFNFVRFSDAKNGFAGGTGGVLLTSKDGGITWVKSYLEGKPNLNSISFPDALNGYITADYALFKTTDGGQTWQKSSNGNTGVQLSSFPTTQVGYGIAGEEVVKYSGQYWERTNFPFTAFDPSTIFFADALRGWVGDFNGSVYYTTDGGNSWKTISTPAPYGQRNTKPGKIYIAKNKTGYAINSSGGIGITKDNGLTWQNSFVPRDENDYPLTDISIPSEQVAFVCGENTIAVTTDQGVHWQHLLRQDGTNLPYTMTGIYFLDNTHGFGVTSSGKLLRFER